ncbi:MAG TPA: hypothetical protein VEL76_42250 [Gemmataceae bacterium]|nr:hypothetical protein [Gemmataceae bacterium]
MDVALRLIDLPAMHPELLWESIIAAAAAVLGPEGATPPYSFTRAIENVMGFGSDRCRFLIDPLGIAANRIAQVRRTYEPSRLVELAAIALTGLALHHAGAHEIVDIAVRGRAADYLVDQAQHQLEIAGRSRRQDVEVAWRQRWERLSARPGGFYLCVTEFEGATGRLAFRP